MLLITQDITKSGSYIGRAVAPSVVNLIIIELERARALDLRQRIDTSLGQGDYEKWACDIWSKLSGVFLLSSPNIFQYMEDTIFQVASATYLGQACPVIMPLVGQYFGKKGQVLDRYGANLAAAALLGHGHIVLHKKNSNPFCRQ